MLYNFEICCGRNANTSLPTHLGVTGDLALKLYQNLPHQKRHKVFFDNYFTLIPLLVELRENGILALGSILQNRVVCAQKLFESYKELKKKGRDSNDWRVDVSSNVVVVKWMDNSKQHCYPYTLLQQHLMKHSPYYLYICRQQFRGTS